MDHEHEHDFWRTKGGALECACGKSKTAPPEEEEETK